MSQTAKNITNASDHLSIIDAMLNALPDASETLSAMDTLDSDENDSGVNLGVMAGVPELPLHFDGWPERHINCRLSPKDPVDDRSWQWWEAYDTAFKAAKQGALIVIYGGHGGGKTQIAMEVARNLPDRFFPAKREGRFTLAPEHRPLLYRKAMEYFNDLRATYGKKSKEVERDVIQRYASAALVVIDEAHERGEKAFEDRQLTLMIDKRYDAMLPTILITNLTKNDFYAPLSPAVKSRMVETAVGIEANWRTFRTRPTDQ